MNRKHFYFAPLFIFTCQCASLYNDYDEKLLENKEFNDSLKVQEIAQKESPPEPVKTSENESTKGSAKSSKSAVSKVKTKNAVIPENKSVETKTPMKTSQHEPTVEDGEGFVGRRPLIDPFLENEELTYAVSYFAVEAGRFTMKTHPFVQVNGKKSYRFTLHARSSSVFSLFYAVDDMAESFLDYEELIPYSYTIKAKESKQVRDVKSFFNWKTMQGKTWDKKIKKGKEPEEKLYEWEILPYSQNVITAAYYMRCFKYTVGKNLSIRVGHEGQNIIMTAKVLREEKLKTGAGTFDTYVIKPEFEIDGVFKPVGDVFMWVTKDQFRRIARIESKIKIGKVVINLQQITP